MICEGLSVERGLLKFLNFVELSINFIIEHEKLSLNISFLIIYDFELYTLIENQWVRIEELSELLKTDFSYCGCIVSEDCRYGRMSACYVSDIKRIWSS